MSIAIISRFMTIDLAYYSEWLEYYDNLGVDFFYLIYVDKIFEDLNKILTYYPKNKIKIEYLNADINANKAFLHVDFDIKEDFILHVDSDEFLYLQGLTLPEFLKKYDGYNSYKFNWLMAPSNKKYNECLCDILCDKESPKYFVSTYKSLAKKKDINKLSNDPHNFSFKNNDVIEFKKFNIFFIIHFSFRGMYDAYLKPKHQKIMDYLDEKMTNLCDFSINKILFRNLPQRFIIYDGEISHKQKIIENFDVELNIKSKSNINYLNKLIDFDEYIIFENKFMIFNKMNLFKDLVLTDGPKVEIMEYCIKYNNLTIDFINGVLHV
jgi:hypothetical protein